MKIKTKLKLRMFLFTSLLFCFYYVVCEFLIFPKVDPMSVAIQTTYHRAENILNGPMDFLIVGDSTAQFNINPLELSGKSISIATVASPLSISLKVLLKQIDSLKVQHILIMNSFSSRHYDSDLWDYLYLNNKVTIPEIMSLKCDLHTCNFLEKTLIYLKAIQYRLHLTERSLTAFLKLIQYFIRSPLVSEVSKDRLEDSYETMLAKNKGHHPKDKSDSNELINFTNSLCSSESYPREYDLWQLKLLLEKAEIMKTKITYILPILYDSSREVNCKKYLQNIKNKLEPLKKRGLIIIDVAQETAIFKQDDFLNFQHLDKNGAIKLTKLLKVKL